MMMTARTMEGMTVQMSSRRLSCAKNLALRPATWRYLFANKNNTVFTTKNTAMMMYKLKFINVS